MEEVASALDLQREVRVRYVKLFGRNEVERRRGMEERGR
jgi:hypothetical protein